MRKKLKYKINLKDKITFNRSSTFKIEDKIKQGENLVNTGRKCFDSSIKIFQDRLFDDAIIIFKEQLENIILIRDASKSEKLRDKILKYLLYTKILKIKSIIITLCSEYSRLEVIEIVKKSGVEENLIIQIINEMIENKEINAEYLSTTESLIFKQQPTNYELTDLMIPFEEWEKDR